MIFILAMYNQSLNKHYGYLFRLFLFQKTQLLINFILQNRQWPMIILHCRKRFVWKNRALVFRLKEDMCMLYYRFMLSLFTLIVKKKQGPMIPMLNVTANTTIGNILLLV
jgi:hypothetical protein